ncbi:MAG: hypothetical protein GEU68_13330 [Actinobacteria bacterium]|nr:hypothetical protein [Actinomycetota bacterium]
MGVTVGIDCHKSLLTSFYDQLLEALDATKHPIKVDIDTYEEPKPKSGVVDLQPWTTFVVRVAEAPVLGRAHGVLLGEILHNFRGVLDHLAWSLVASKGRKRLTRAQGRNVAFPLTRTRANLGRRWHQWLPGVAEDQFWTLFDRYQPYRRTIQGVAMRRLRNLSDIDKHRVIVPTVVLPQVGDLNVHYEGGELISVRQLMKFGQAARPGLKIMSVTLAGGHPGGRKVELQGVISSIPIFTDAVLRSPKGTLGCRSKEH